MQSSHANLTALVGREVYTSSGVFVGEVEDLRLNMGRKSVTGLALNEVHRSELCQDREKQRKGVMIPYRAVKTVGDVILVYDYVASGFDGPE